MPSRFLADHWTLLAGVAMLMPALLGFASHRHVNAFFRHGLIAFGLGLGLLHNFQIFPDAGFG